MSQLLSSLLLIVVDIVGVQGLGPFTASFVASIAVLPIFGIENDISAMAYLQPHHH
jgi:hypothetical protein